jgi:hypothetical protein
MTELERTIRERLGRLDQPGSGEEPDTNQNLMGTVGPDAVGLGRPTTKGNVDIPALPPSAGKPPTGPVPGFQPASPQDLNPSSPGLRPPKVNTRVPGYGAVDPLPNRTHQRSGEQSQAASSSPAASSAWEALSTKWAPAGLAVALAALLAVGCKGAPCSNLLRPAPALRGFPVTPVPGHLQG